MHLPILGNLPIIGDFPLHIHITLRRVHITILAVVKQYLLHIWVCVYSLSYPTCKAVDCIVLSSVACLAYLINGTIFRKRVNEHKICFDFLCNFFSEKFLILRRIKQDSIVNVNRYFCHILIKLEYSQQIFKKNHQRSNFITIHPAGAELFHADGRADRQDEANNQSTQFCKCTRYIPVTFCIGRTSLKPAFSPIYTLGSGCSGHMSD
jgi:hypothetical protein